MTPLQQILGLIREQSPSERDKGSAFEALIRFYLRNDRKYDFSEVLYWRDWATGRGLNAADTGIDLVATERETGRIWAIQCKFYREDARVYKRHVDSFFTESRKEPFGHRLIVLSTSNLSQHVEHAKERQQMPCSTLNLLDLEESAIDWGQYFKQYLNKYASRVSKQIASLDVDQVFPDAVAIYKEKKSLRPHQQKALHAVTAGFEVAERGKLLMACGTGKTFTALKIAEQIVGAGGKVLFLMPSISLLSQSIAEWTNESDTPLRLFAVCSDSTAGKRKSDDSADITISDLAYPATTNASRLAEQLTGSSVVLTCRKN